MKKQYVFLIVGLLIITIIIGILITRCSSHQNMVDDITVEDITPEEIIEEYLGLKLPATASFTNFDYPNNYGRFGGKILIDEESVSDIETQLSNSNFLNKLESKDFDRLPNFVYGFPWWDMQREDIIYGYFSVYTKHIDENTTTSGERWIFVVQDNEGLYYLYTQSY